jgi:hypothetical protein
MEGDAWVGRHRAQLYGRVAPACDIAPAVGCVLGLKIGAFVPNVSSTAGHAHPAPSTSNLPEVPTVPALLKRTLNTQTTITEQEPPSPLVAAVIASVGATAEGLRGELSHREFREQVRAYGRSCDEVLLDIRRAALRGENGVPVPAEITRRRITGRRASALDAVRLDQLEAENARLRAVVANQRLDLDALRRRA